MKKIAAAAVAATMTVSLAAAPAADAASNTMSGSGRNETCTLYLEGVGRVTTTPNKVDDNRDIRKAFADENIGLVRTSADLGQAFGSSDPELIALANNIDAVQACKASKDYKSKEMTTWEQAGIIIGVILAVIGAIAPIVAPMIQQHLPF